MSGPAAGVVGELSGKAGVSAKGSPDASRREHMDIYIFLFKRFILVFCLPVHLCTVYMQYIQRPEEGIEFSRTGVPGGC